MARKDHPASDPLSRADRLGEQLKACPRARPKPSPSSVVLFLPKKSLEQVKRQLDR